MNDDSTNERTDEDILNEKWYESFGFQFAVVAVVVFVLFRFIFGIGLISGDSMEPTLHEGEFMFFRRICYTPERGDVVLCRPDFYKSRTEANEMLLKRVIAVGGDTIDIDYETGDVLVNGAVLEESYIAEKIDLAGYTRENPNPNYVDFPYTVDEGCVFVMGDNRNYSIDSRLYFFGEVPEDDIVGKLLYPQTN